MHTTNIIGILNLSKETIFNKNIKSRCLKNNTCDLNVSKSIPISENGDVELKTIENAWITSFPIRGPIGCMQFFLGLIDSST